MRNTTREQEIEAAKKILASTPKNLPATESDTSSPDTLGTAATDTTPGSLSPLTEFETSPDTSPDDNTLRKRTQHQNTRAGEQGLVALASTKESGERLLMNRLVNRFEIRSQGQDKHTPKVTSSAYDQHIGAKPVSDRSYDSDSSDNPQPRPTLSRNRPGAIHVNVDTGEITHDATNASALNDITIHSRQAASAEAEMKRQSSDTPIKAMTLNTSAGAGAGAGAGSSKGATVSAQSIDMDNGSARSPAQPRNCLTTCWALLFRRSRRRAPVAPAIAPVSMASTNISGRSEKTPQAW